MLTEYFKKLVNCIRNKITISIVKLIFLSKAFQPICIYFTKVNLIGITLRTKTQVRAVATLGKVSVIPR